MKNFKILLFITLTIFALSSFAKSEEKGVYKFIDVEVDDIKVGNAVDFTFDKNGEDVKFSELTKGKVVFLNFWGTWCPPCRKEIPYIVDIQKELKDKDFIVVGVATERGTIDQSVKKVENFAKNNNINYMNLVMDGKKQILKQAYQKATSNPLQYVPTTIIIDRDGNIDQVIVGGKDKAGFMAAINKVLK